MFFLGNLRGVGFKERSLPQSFLPSFRLFLPFPTFVFMSLSATSTLGPEAALASASDALDDALSVLEAALEPYLRPEASLSAAVQRLSDTPLEAARLHASLATGVLSLASCYLRVAGVDVGAHDIKREFASLRTINERIKTTSVELDRRKEERDLRLKAVEAKKERDAVKEGSSKKRLPDDNEQSSQWTEGSHSASKKKRR